MHLRLTHVLVLMTLVLVAGILSVHGLEAYVGATSVPGVVVVDVPGLEPGTLAGVGRGRGGAAWFAVVASGEPCAPFDSAFARRAAAGGTATLLLAATPLADRESLRDAWGVVIAPDAGSGSDAANLADVDAAAARLAAFVSTQHGTRPFLAGLTVDARPLDRIGALVDPLIEAAAALPPYRRTSVVLLGERLADPSRRVALRFDVGRWEGHARPALADLLEDIP
jgi:hypothetical protein